MRIATDHLRVHPLGRDRWLGRLALLALWGAGVAYYASLGAARAGSAGAICGVPFLLLAGTSLIVGLNHGRSVAGVRGRGTTGQIRIAGGEITILGSGKALKWARSDVVSGWSELWPEGETVVLGARSGVFVSFVVPPGVRAHDVLNTIGVAPDQRAAVIRLGVQEPGLSRVVMLFLSLVLGGILVCLVPLVAWMLLAAVWQDELPWSIPVAILAVGLPTFAYLYHGLVRPLVPSTVRIGTDGVAIERLFRRRFVRRDEIDQVTVLDRNVELWRAGRVIARLPASGPAQADAVAGCIRAALAEARDDGARAALLEKLDRGGRRFDAWLKELRALSKGQSRYREAAGDPRELLDIAKSGAVSPVRRIAAAAVLAGHEDPKLRIELREAAAACANLRLRVALEKASEGEIEESDLEGLAEPEARAHQSQVP